MTRHETVEDKTELTALRRKARTVHNRLYKLYGEPRWTKIDGVSELVSTILSQNTNDGNRDLAYTRLRARFATWEMVRDGFLGQRNVTSLFQRPERLVIQRRLAQQLRGENRLAQFRNGLQQFRLPRCPPA